MISMTMKNIMIFKLYSILILFLLINMKEIDSYESNNQHVNQEEEIYFLFNVNSNIDLVNLSLKKNWSGNGTISNPFMISNLHILTNQSIFSITNINYHINIINCSFISNNENIAILIYKSKNIKIVNCTIDNFSDSINIYDSNNVSIQNNIFMNNNNAIKIDYYSDHIYVNNNSLKRNNYDIIISGSNININENIFTNNIIFQHANKIRFFENNISSNVSNIVVDSSNKIYINSNFIRANISTYSILNIIRSKNVTLSSNIIRNVMRMTVGIKIDSYSSYLYMENNLLFDCIISISPFTNLNHHYINITNLINYSPVYFLYNINNKIFEEKNIGQIFIYYCNNISFSGIISNFSNKFIDIYKSDNISIKKSLIKNDSIKAINIDLSKNIFIQDSKFISCNICINIKLSDKVIIVNSTFINNNYGIYSINSINININNSLFFMNNVYSAYLESTRDSIIQSNTFIFKNDKNSACYNNLIETKWDNCTKGNYWSNWEEPDINNDGIVDQPYEIDIETNFINDRYPLVFSPKQLISKPMDFKCVIDNKTLYFSWKRPSFSLYSNITRFKILVTDNGTEKSLIDNISATNRTYILREIELSGNIEFYIIAYNDYDMSEKSNLVNLFIDKDGPYINVHIEKYFNTENISFYLEILDNHTEIVTSMYKLDYNDWVNVEINDTIYINVNSEGEHIIHVKAKNNQNIESYVKKSFIIDKSKPIFNIKMIPSKYYLNDNKIIFNIKASDNISCIANVSYTFNDVNVYINNEASISLEIDKDGQYKISFTAIDNAGNFEIKEFFFIIDRIKPELKLFSENPIKTNLSKITLKWKVLDLNSGILNISIRIDNNNWIDINPNIEEFYINNLTEGSHIIYFQIVDKAGNVNFTTVTIEIDKTPPIITENSYDKDKTQNPVIVLFNEDINKDSLLLFSKNIYITYRWYKDELNIYIENITKRQPYWLNISIADLSGNYLINYFLINETIQYEVQIYLTNEKNQPIQDVELYIFNIFENLSDKNGKINLFLYPGLYSLKINHSEYYGESLEVEIFSNQTINIILKQNRVIDNHKGNISNINYWIIIFIIPGIIIIILILIYIKRLRYMKKSTKYIYE